MNSAPVIALEELEKSYGDAETRVAVLKGIDLIVRKGDFVSIVGPSGSGKSTLLNILGCLDRPSRGRYLFLGDDVSRLGDAALSHIRNHRIGFVFQSFQLIPHLTVLENVQLPLLYARVGKAERAATARRLLERVGLSHRLRHRPNQLSGGEMQRTAIARALANSPDVVLADEPTGNLDSKTSVDIMELLGELHREGATLVLITHDLEVAALAPRRVSILDGVLNEAVSA
ncbi:MAG TPA: ABC transporter ATP-binding protein [Planctomycetes bacterium]|nr:ABC transporter ATP-binding protein [Planctomycetota bacterium]